MPVGNDVIDLGDSESREGSLHDRYDQRVFTESEQAVLSSALTLDVRERLRWIIWSAKESAFKAAKQFDEGVRFIPNAFRVRLEADGDSTWIAEVSHDVAGRFRSLIEVTQEWIHSVAVPLEKANPTPVISRQVAHLAAELSSASDFVREELRRSVAEALSVPVGSVAVVSDHGVPRLTVRGRAVPFDISLSHHGRWVAWAWSPRHSEPAV